MSAVRPALRLEAGDEALLHNVQQSGSLTTVEFGRYPYVVLDEGLRALAGREYARGALAQAPQPTQAEALPLPRTLLE